MAVDSNIALGVQPISLPNPLQQYMQAQQAQSLMGQNKLADLMYKDKQREINDTLALNQQFKNSVDDTGNIDRPALMRNMAANGLGSRVPGIQKSFLETDKLQAGIDETKAKTSKTKVETTGLTDKQVEEKRQRAVMDIAMLKTPEEALAGLEAHTKMGDITPEAAAMVRQTIPTNPSDFPKWQIGMLQRIMAPKDAIKQIAPDANTVANNRTQLAVQDRIDARQNSDDVANLTPGAIDNAAARYNIDGTLPPMGMGQAAAAGRTKILNRAAEMKLGISPEQQRLDQLYNKGDVAARNASVRDFSSAGKSGQAIQAANTSLNHLETVEQLAMAQKNGQVALFNKLANKLSAELGGTAPTNLQAALIMVAPEVSKAVIGASGTGEERAAFEKRFQGNGSPEQALEGIGTIKELMGGRLTESQRTYERTTQKNDFEKMLSPAAKKVLSKAHGAASPTGSQQTPTVNAKGWTLHVDANGSQAYVSPDGKSFEEVK